MIDRARTKINEYEKRYQLDLSYIIKNEFWVYLRQGIVLSTGLAVAVVFARLAPKEVLGQYNFILAILAIVSILSIPGLNTAVMQSVARGYDGSYKQAVKTRLLWSLLGIPALLGVGAYYYYHGDNQIIGICLMISSIFFPFLTAPNTFDSFLAGKKRFNITTRYGGIQASINAAVMITVLFVNANSLILVFAAYLVSNTFLTCLLFLKSLKYIETNAQDNECVGYGYFMTITNIVGTVASNIDRILIGTLLGAPELAIYVIAVAIPRKAKDFLKMGQTPLTPKLCQDEIRMGTVLEKMKRFVLPLTLMILGVALLYWLFIDDVILLLFGKKYMDSIVYSRILVLMILVSVPNVFLGSFAIAKKKTKSIVLGYHIFPFLKLLIMFGFIYQWGIWGAVWGLNLSIVVQGLLVWIGIGSEEWSL